MIMTAPPGSLQQQPGKVRVCVCTSNRSDYAKLQPVMRRLRDDTTFELSVIALGSHVLEECGNTYKQIESDGFPIDYKLHTTVLGSCEAAVAQSIGQVICQLPPALAQLSPDFVIVHGDRYEALGIATAAAFMNIKILHIEGGEVSGTIADSVRHSISKLAHLHAVCTDAARQRLIGMAEDPDTILVAGCPSYCNLLSIDPAQGLEDVLTRYGLRKGEFIICIYHPDSAAAAEGAREFRLLLDALDAFGQAVLLVKPNIDAGTGSELIADVSARQHKADFVCVDNIPNLEFIKLMASCGMLVGNSSAGVREAGVFGTPVVNVGTRQSCREHGDNVVDVPHPTSPSDLLEAFAVQYRRNHPPCFLYGDGTADQRIVDYLKAASKDRRHSKTTHKRFIFSPSSQVLQ